MRSRVALAAHALLLTTIVAGLAAGPTRAEEENLDDVLAGFGDEAAPEDDLDDVLGGFEDEAPGEEDLDEALTGFDDDESAGADDETPVEASSRPSYLGGQHRFWEVTGSLSLGASYNVRPHYASLGPDPTAQNGTYFGNLQRLRLRGDLQIDLKLPYDWKARGQGFLWYDYAFAIHGKSKYTDAVLREYEARAEVLDLYVEGSVTSFLDLKIGRQVVNWGRSDTLRVNDVLNPLDNLEPGLTDIENLRLPVTMVKADAYWGPWSFTAIVVPELRYDWDPPPGNDFFPSLSFGADDLPPLPPAPIPDSILALIPPELLAQLQQSFDARLAAAPAVAALEAPDRSSSQWGSTPEFAGAITGIFSGWDVSLYAARVYQNRTTTLINLPEFSTRPIFRDDDLVTHVGAGGNYTLGSWLLKAEMAYVGTLDYDVLLPDWSQCPIPMTPADLNPATLAALQTCIPYRVTPVRATRLDSMAGVEYYGINDVNLALEAAYRHVFGYDELLRFLPNYVYQHNLEIALRVSQELMNDRLSLTGLGLVLLNERGFFGSTIRLSADYELFSGLVIGGGLLYFIGSDQVPFDTWAKNDRLFMSIKYSF